MLCADTPKALSREFAVSAQQRAAELAYSCLSRNALAVLAYLERTPGKGETLGIAAYHTWASSDRH